MNTGLVVVADTKSKNQFAPNLHLLFDIKQICLKKSFF